MEDRLLEKVKEYFNDHFDEQDKKLEAIEKKLNEVLGQNEDLKESAENNNILLQSIHKGGLTFMLQLESLNLSSKALHKYVQDLARVNGWKLPEKQRVPREV